MKRILTHFSFVLALIIVSTTCAFATPPVKAGPPMQTLRGEFATIGTRSCIQAEVGGDFGSEPMFQLLSNGSSRVTQEAGVLSLFGDGTGAWSGTAVMINYSAIAAGSYPVSGYTTDCDIAYQRMPDGTIKFAFDNCISTFTDGYYGSETQGGSTHFTAQSARLSADGITMVIWDLDPRIENIWTTTSGVTTYYKRICSRTGTAIKFR